MDEGLNRPFLLGDNMLTKIFSRFVLFLCIVGGWENNADAATAGCIGQARMHFSSAQAAVCFKRRDENHTQLHRNGIRTNAQIRAFINGLVPMPAPNVAGQRVQFILQGGDRLIGWQRGFNDQIRFAGVGYLVYNTDGQARITHAHLSF